jgi:hypothetical protein
MKPVIWGLRSTPHGPVKLTTSDAIEKLAVFIGSLNVNSNVRGPLRVL